MTTEELIEDYVNATNEALYAHNWDINIDENEETQCWRCVNNLRRKLQKQLRKVEKQVINLLDNEPTCSISSIEDCDDAYQTRLEWTYEYKNTCEEMYQLRTVLGLRRMNAQEWYHNYKRNKKNDKK